MNIDRHLVNGKKDDAILGFHYSMQEMYEKMDIIFKNISGDERFLINSHISIAFLYGNVEIDKAYNTYSPHLKGTFSLSAGRTGTGILNLDSILNSNKHPDKDKLLLIVDWLNDNNPLYKELNLLNVDFFITRIVPSFAPANEVVGITRLSNSNDYVDYGQNNESKIPISLPDENENKVFKYLKLEEALALCFSMLFPTGIIPKIPVKTIRGKSLTLISSHEFYRCLSLQYLKTLFLYNVISTQNAYFVQNRLSFQKANIPSGSSRDIPSNFRRRDDLAFPEYWYSKQSHVRAMCAELSDSDLMFTFTFVNK